MKLSSVTSSSIVDPRKEGLPLFATYFGSLNQNFSHRVLNSDFQAVGSPWASQGNTTATYQHGMLNTAVFGYSSSSDAITHVTSSLSSEDYTAWSSWGQSLHQIDQYPSSAYGSTSALGFLSWFRFLAGQSKLDHGYKLINQVMPEGMRPRRFFGMISNTFMEFKNLSAMTYGIDILALETLPGVTRTYSLGNGTAGYNERTQTLVTVHSSNGTCIATKFVNANVNLNTCSSLSEFFSTATMTEFPIEMSTSGSDSNSDKVIVVGDNNWVGISYRQGTSMYASTYDLTGGGSAPIHMTTLNMTTSYGVSYGSQYYTKMNTTWDGMWAAAYTPYYYYGSGCFGYVFSTTDPRRCMNIQNSTTSGGALVAIGKSGFTYFSSLNCDGYSIYQIGWDFKTTNKLYAAGAETTYSHTNESGVRPINQNGQMNSSTSGNTSGIEGGHGSTCYPYFQTVNYWSLNGKNTYEGV